MPDMGGGGSAPQAPDPRVTIPLQEDSNMRQFYEMLNATRSDSSNPYGSSTWDRQEIFDEAGYNAAMAEWQSQYGQPAAPVDPNFAVDYSFGETGRGGPDSTSRTGGALSGLAGIGGGGNTPAMPSRSDFVSWDYDQTSAFNPETQGRWDKVQGLMGGLLDSYGQTGQGDLNLIDDAGGKYSQDLADAIYRRTTRLSDPAMEQAQKTLEQRLAERGFQVGNEGYNTEMDRLGTQRSEHYSDAADRAQIQAAQQALAEAGFTNQSRIAEFQGENQYRAQLAQLLSGLEGQMFAGLQGNPSSFQAPQLPGIDVLGAYNNKYLGELDAYNADQASSAGLLNSILGIGASFLLPGAGSALTAGLGGAMGLRFP